MQPHLKVTEIKKKKATSFFFLEVKEEKLKHISTNSFENIFSPITIFFNIEAANSVLFIFKVTVAQNGIPLKELT